MKHIKQNLVIYIYLLVLMVWSGCSGAGNSSLIAPSKAGGAGRLTVDKPLVTLGVVEPAENITENFTFTNDSNEDLTINNIVSSCTCTVGKLKIPTTLKPGQSVSMEAIFNTPSTAGKFIQTIKIIFGPTSPPEMLMVSIDMQVKKLIQAQPENLEFEIRDGFMPGKDIVIESTDGYDFTITGYTCSGNAIQLTYDKTSKAARHSLKMSSLDFDRLRLAPSGYLVINVTHPKISEVMIPFRAIVPFSAFPPTGRFYNLKPGQSQTLALKVVSNFREDFQLGEIRSEKGVVKTKEITKTSDGYKIVLEMKMPQDFQEKLYRDQLILEILDHPQDNLLVNCYGYQRLN